MEIVRLPVITVHRADAARLDLMGMKPRECHTNAGFMEQNDPEGRTKQIIGWWPQGGNYVLHSIVITRAVLLLHPVEETLVPETQFEFLSDPKIEVREQDGFRFACRDGVKIGAGVRHDPTQALANAEIVR